MNGKILPIALAISLTLNVFIVGAAVGAFGARARFTPMRPPPARAMVGNPVLRVADQLPPDVANAYRQRIRAELDASRPLQQEARSARQQASDTFAQDKFDKPAALAALAKARTNEVAAREKLETTIVDFAADLPQDQRQVLSRALRPPRPGGPGRRSGMGGPPGGPDAPGFGGGPPQGDQPR
ncbi:MAG TPA: periplasmic heavy metal sensor [Caulobacteraceae bacterium]|nr:periplasmic heavy metal sensor [Caulobacteraceae bacterium]